MATRIEGNDGGHLTAQQAADLLNVSREYLEGLLVAKLLPHGGTAKAVTLAVADVLAFKERRDAERRAKLDELTRLSEDLGRYEE